MEKNENLYNGLSSSEVQSRINEGKVNIDNSMPTKSVKRIFIDNIVTLFNIVNIILFCMLIVVGSYKNMLFMGVILCNIIIGIVQELRSKKAVDKLSIMVSKNVSVMRDGQKSQVSVEQIVLDDIIVLKRGNQIPSDCVVLSGECYVNESLLTGESDLIIKRKDSKLMSGSFISSGECYARVVSVGNDNYASKIHSEAKYIKKVNSQIMDTLRAIIKFCSIMIVPVGIAMFVSKYFVNALGFTDSVVSVVGALIGMIPEGLVLLTSTVLAVAVIRLSKRKVLVQELFCIETLARVDVLCLDKTGTITCDEMVVTDVITFDSHKEYLNKILSSLAKASTDENSTINAVRDYSKDFPNFNSKNIYPFSSEKKWSGATLEDGSTYILGAAEFILDKNSAESQVVFDKISNIQEPVRILTVAKTDKEIVNGVLPNDMSAVGLILIKDKIRPNAKETINYFDSQGVNLKVISGDGVNTVSNIAKEAGIKNADLAVDATTLTTDEQINDAAQRYNVFGRVTPQQKKKLILALKEAGNTVAMTGDGVNDVLALKEADCSVAMAVGSEAARNVSQLVLIDNDFSSMPYVVAEGRRSINNIQRSASLFLEKTIYSIVLAITFIFLSISYPFEPIQLSFLGALTIGIPSFVLALQPNHEIIRGNFLINVISRSIPGAILTITNVLIPVFLGGYFGLSTEECSTMAVILTGFSGILLVIRLSLPLNPIRVALILFIVAGSSIGIIFFRQFLSLVTLSENAIIVTVVLAVITVIVFNILYTIADRIMRKHF